jgi:outer membrane protein TolC
MRRLKETTLQLSGAAAGILLAIVLLSSMAFAQPGPSQSQSGSAPAAQLPLSGRTGQSGSVATGQSSVPGTTTSVNTINPSVQIQGSFGGSRLSTARIPFSGTLSLREAVDRGIEFNLGAVGVTQVVRQSHGQNRAFRSTLLPNVTASLGETVEQLNLAANGFRFNSPVPGFSVPGVVGPFNFVDLRASLTQNVVDFTALNNYRASNESLRAAELSAQDARDLVVLAVGGSYLQVIAAKARVTAARAQLETANALYKQTTEQHNAGLVSQIDVNRSQVQALTQQQRLVSLQNDLSKQKINLARLTGLAANDNYDISNDVPFSPGPPLTVDQALKQAFEQRSDLKAAQAQVRAAERARAAARAERLPTFSVRADYGVLGTNPSQSHGTFAVAATIRVPIWQGGRIEGDIEQAEAALVQRQSEQEDIRSRIESEVRSAYLDLQAATSQVELAEKNLQTSKQNLELTRQRYEAGVSDNVDVVQSQESVASAQLDYINSVFAHNLAKLSLARAIGRASENLAQFLKLQ